MAPPSPNPNPNPNPNHNPNPNPNPGPNHHNPCSITIDMDRLAKIQDRINTPPTILSKAAGRASCSIFKVPKSFKEFHPKLYHPQIVSIGPFHHGRDELQMMEEHKYQYLGQLLSRTGLKLSSLFHAVLPIESPARDCYSEAIPLGPHHHLEMLVLDGCFVVELFRKVARRIEFEPDDPIAALSWVFPALLRDLHRLENQIPFFVLQKLFDETYVEEVDGKREDEDEKPTLALLGLEFFNNTVQRPPQVLLKYKDVQPQHLLDLIRSSFITPNLEQMYHSSSKRRSTPSHVILPVSKLRQAGIHLQQAKSETFLEVKFKPSGIIEMPKITLDDFMSSLLGNCVAYEQCHKGASTYFTTYATLVDCLVNTAKDVEYLCDKSIVENYFGTEAEIATFINNLGKDVAFDIDQCYLAKLFADVNVYYKNNWHVQWASLKYTYFNSPWSFISAVAAFVLLVLTVLQTLYTVMPYYIPSS